MVTVANATEAATLLIALGAVFPAAQAVTDAMPADNRTDEMRLTAVLQRMRNSQSAQLLRVLAGSTDWMSTDEIRSGLGLPAGANIGPLFSNVTHALKGSGLRKSQVLRRFVRKPNETGGQWLYWFKLTRMARSVVDGFEMVRAFDLCEE